MRKTKTSKKRKKSATKYLRVHEPFASQELKDSALVTDTLLDCLREGDVETFRDVFVAHLMTVNKSKIAKKAGIGRRTLYDLLDPKREFNPGFTTLAAVIRAIAA